MTVTCVNCGVDEVNPATLVVEVNGETAYVCDLCRKDEPDADEMLLTFASIFTETFH